MVRKQRTSLLVEGSLGACQMRQSPTWNPVVRAQASVVWSYAGFLKGVHCRTSVLSRSKKCGLWDIPSRSKLERCSQHPSQNRTRNNKTNRKQTYNADRNRKQKQRTLGVNSYERLIQRLHSSSWPRHKYMCMCCVFTMTCVSEIICRCCELTGRCCECIGRLCEFTWCLVYRLVPGWPYLPPSSPGDESDIASSSVGEAISEKYARCSSLLWPLRLF